MQLAVMCVLCSFIVILTYNLCLDWTQAFLSELYHTAPVFRQICMTKSRMKSLGLRWCSLCQWIPAAIHYSCAYRPITEVVAGTSNSSISVVDVISVNVTLGAILLLDDWRRVSDRGVRILGSDTAVVWSSVLEVREILKGSSSLPLPSSPIPCPAANELNVVEITRWPAYVCRKNKGRMTAN